MKIQNLPNKITDFDLNIIEKIKNDKSIEKFFYHDQMHYKYVSHDNLSNIYHLKKSSISFNCERYLEDVFIEGDLLSFIPCDLMFQEFKSELIIGEMFVRDFSCLKNDFLSEQISKVKGKIFSITEPNTGVFILYHLEELHPFKVIINDKNFFFDSLDLSIKFLFETAIKNDYIPPKLRNRLKILEEMMANESL